MLTRLLERPDGEVGRMVWRTPNGVLPSTTPAKAPDPAIRMEEELRRAYERGIAEGEARARQGAEAQVARMGAQVAASIAELSGVRAQIIAGAQADVVRLSMDIARRILHRELSLDPDALSALIRAALEKLGSQATYRARVHPAQAPVVRRCLIELRGNAEIEITADPGLPEGGMLFESEHGTLDASAETQLREIERGLADHLGDRQ